MSEAYRVRFMEEAVRDLEQLDRAVARRILRRLQWVAENMEVVRLEPLKGSLKGLYKLWIGPYRVLYEILPQERILLVHLIGHRREIYRRRR